MGQCLAEEGDLFIAERPVTITLHLSTADVELALTSAGTSLQRLAVQAVVLAKVFDMDCVEI
jgi:hypothetical protein